MKYNISRDLFETVIGVLYFEKYEVDGDYIWIKRDGGYSKRYHSVNDFFFKCKEWAYKQGYMITTFYANNIVHVRCQVGDYEKRCYGECCDEITPTFEMCQWILEQKDKQ